MGCDCKKNAPPKPARDIIDVLFGRGNVKGAAAHRQAQCAHSSECGYFCVWLDKSAQGIPSCEAHPRTENLYEALKRRDFRCPENRF